MSERRLQTLTAAQVRALDVLPAAAVDLRRDVCQLVGYVRDRGLVRTRRNNAIPKSAALRLAKLLSDRHEAEQVEEHGCGCWSDYVSQVARRLGLVAFDIEGEYAGYTSTAPSFPDNRVKVRQKAFADFVRLAARAAERKLLDDCLGATGNEFFRRATLIDGERFDRSGCAVGPAGAMDLARIRRGLLDLLRRELEPDVWYEHRSVVELLKTSAPHLILDPATRDPDSESARRLSDWEWQRKYGSGRKSGEAGKKPDVTLRDIYTNFREYPAGESAFGKKRQLTSRTRDAFHRVEGRYLEYFLCEIPYILGFVERAFRQPGDPHGADVSPAFERLRAFRLTRRMFQVLAGDAELDRVKVTVLPTFEVLVEAPSYPTGTLHALEPYTVLEREEGALHRLRIERNRVVAAAAAAPEARPVAELLAELTGSTLPDNVAVELDTWSRRGDQVVLYDGLGLVEFRGAKRDRRAALSELGELVVEADANGFALVREPDRALRLLAAGGHVPVLVKHPAERLASHDSKRAAGASGRGSRRPAPQRPQVRVAAEDLVGYRSPDRSFLKALHEALADTAPCTLVGDDLLLFAAAELPQVRSAVRSLSQRFDVRFEPAAPGGRRS